MTMVSIKSWRMAMHSSHANAINLSPSNNSLLSKFVVVP
jgi:hypothetical protein